MPGGLGPTQEARGDVPSRWRRLRAPLRLVLALFFVTTGVLHFVRPEPFVQIVPRYLPHPLALVHVSGACEILGGFGVLVPRLRRAAGWGLIALLVAVFPANLHMALGDVRIEGRDFPPLLLWLRLPLQGVLIAWVWWCTRGPSGEVPARGYNPGRKEGERNPVEPLPGRARPPS